MSDFTDRPVLHPNFPLLCFAIEALDYKKEATALADTQDKADLLEWLGKSILNGWTFEWNPHQGMFEVLNDEGRYVAGSGQWIDAIRAAKEASNAE